MGQSDQSDQNLVVLRNLGLAWAVRLPLLEEGEHLLAGPLIQGGQRTGAMSSHWCIHIDCMALVQASTVLAQVGGVEVADVEHNGPCHWT